MNNFQSSLSNRFSVRVGEYDLSTDGETQHVDITVKSKVPHPAYDKRDGHSDLAILALEDEINFTSMYYD